MVGGDCRRVHHCVGGFVNTAFIIVEGYANAFILQGICEFGWRFVVPRNLLSQAVEISRNGTHANASNANEVNAFYGCNFYHAVCCNMNLAIVISACGVAICLMFDASDWHKVSSAKTCKAVGIKVVAASLLPIKRAAF